MSSIFLNIGSFILSIGLVSLLCFKWEKRHSFFRMKAAYWLCAFIFFVPGVLLANNANAPRFTEKKTERLMQEMTDLKNSLKKFQNRLTKVVQELDTIKPLPTIQVPAKTNLWALQHIEKFSLYLKKRGQEFASGLIAIFHMLSDSAALANITGLSLLGFFFSFSVGIFSVLLGRPFIKRKLFLLKKQWKINNFNQLLSLTTIILLFSLIYFIISILVGISLDHFKIINYVLFRSGYCALLPFNIYLLWACRQWVTFALSPKRPSQATIPVDPYGAHWASVWIQLAFLFYAAGYAFLALLEPLSMTQIIVRTIIDMIFLLMGFCLWRGIALIAGHLLPGPYNKRILWGLSLTKWFIVGFFGLWLIGRDLFKHFFLPITITVCVLVMVHPLRIFFRRWRLRLIWHRRHSLGPFRPFLVSKKTMDRIFFYGVYGTLFFVWLTYLWNDEPSVLSIMITWVVHFFSGPFMSHVLNVMLIVGGAIFLVKGGERILKYYVEDKYTNDSAENNFLASRLKTLMAMLRTALRIVIWIPAISIVFTQFGDVNITAWITSIGAASFGLTFGFQSIVRDFITGFFIILENNLMVGDEVDVDQRTGKVEVITLRTLKIRADNGTLMTIPFGNIGVIGNKNRNFSAIIMNISVDYNSDLEIVQSLVEKAFSILKKTPTIGRRVMGNMEIRGVNEITSYSMVFQVKIKTIPNEQDLVRRVFNKILKHLFDEAGIRVPIPPHTVMKYVPSLTNTLGA